MKDLIETLKLTAVFVLIIWTLVFSLASTSPESPNHSEYVE